jgi:hypothetical protein
MAALAGFLARNARAAVVLYCAVLACPDSPNSPKFSPNFWVARLAGLGAWRRRAGEDVLDRCLGPVLLAQRGLNTTDTAALVLLTSLFLMRTPAVRINFALKLPALQLVAKQQDSFLLLRCVLHTSGRATFAKSRKSLGI